MIHFNAFPDRDQSPGEESANSISHGIGLVAAIAGTPFLVMHSARYGDTGFFVGSILFSATMIALYLSSTIYHALPVGMAKRMFRVIEHSAIFLLIAGTYTPFTLGVLSGTWGWTIFGLVWGFATVGVVLKIFKRASHPLLSTGLYLLMGWIIIIALGPLVARVPVAGLLWLIGGGLSYTVGVIFYVTDARLRYGHLIWHLFVLSGTVCHFFAVLWYAAS